MITDDQIRELQTEASAHGDTEMARVCQSALDGNAADREECEEAIEEAVDQLTPEERAAEAEQDRRTMCREYGVSPW